MNQVRSKEEVLRRTVVLIPALNEEESIGDLLRELKALHPELPVVVISDGSSDDTSGRALAAGARVISLPYNIGVAGAMQAGFRFARENGFLYALRLDGDGQHDPASINNLAEEMGRGEADLVVGSRYLGGEGFDNTVIRTVGIAFLSAFLSYICKHRTTDPTSGCQMVNRKLMHYFAERYPEDYPEPESLALVRRQGYAYHEVPALFRKRLHGVSSINGWSSIYFAMKVTFSLVVDRARTVDRAFSNESLSKVFPDA